MSDQDYKNIVRQLTLNNIKDFRSLLEHYDVKSFADLDARLNKNPGGSISKDESNIIAAARWSKFLGL